MQKKQAWNSWKNKNGKATWKSSAVLKNTAAAWDIIPNWNACGKVCSKPDGSHSGNRKNIVSAARGQTHRNSFKTSLKIIGFKHSFSYQAFS